MNNGFGGDCVYVLPFLMAGSQADISDKWNLELSFVPLNSHAKSEMNVGKSCIIRNWRFFIRGTDWLGFSCLSSLNIGICIEL